MAARRQRRPPGDAVSFIAQLESIGHLAAARSRTTGLLRSASSALTLAGQLTTRRYRELHFQQYEAAEDSIMMYLPACIAASDREAAADSRHMSSRGESA